MCIRDSKKVAEKEISSAEEEATRILNEAIKSSESKKREVVATRIVTIIFRMAGV